MLKSHRQFNCTKLKINWMCAEFSMQKNTYPFHKWNKFLISLIATGNKFVSSKHFFGALIRDPVGFIEHPQCQIIADSD